MVSERLARGWLSANQFVGGKKPRMDTNPATRDETIFRNGRRKAKKSGTCERKSTKTRGREPSMANEHECIFANWRWKTGRGIEPGAAEIDSVDRLSVLFKLAFVGALKPSSFAGRINAVFVESTICPDLSFICPGGEVMWRDGDPTGAGTWGENVSKR